MDRPPASADQVRPPDLVVERRDDEGVILKPAILHYSIDFGLAGKVGNVELPPLIASTLGKVDQIKCLTPASLAARMAAVAC